MTLAEAREAGFELEDYETDIVEVFPENIPALELIQRIGTRWIVVSLGGMGGGTIVTGIRWEAVYPLMDRMALSPEDFDALLADLEVMEQEALKVINQK